MKDRYLYKAKRIDNGEWEIGSLIILPNGKYEIANGCTNPPDSDPMWGKCVITHEIDPFTICQCAGLKDKNGKLIWENDIIKTFDAGEEWCLSKIIFADTSLGYGWKTTDIKTLSEYNNDLFKEVGFGSFDSKSVEIVGNIFDNKELLESEEK